MIQSAQIGAITFNDNSNYYIESIKGLEMPPVRVVNYNLAGEHFGIFVSALYGKRAFSLSGIVKGSTITEYIEKRDALQQAIDVLGGEQSIKFTLTNGRQIQIDAVCVGLDSALTNEFVAAGKFNISFQASYPFLVGQTNNSQSVGLSYGGGGKVAPDTMPAALNSASGGSVAAINNGNGIYHPSARIYGPVVNPAIRNDTYNQELGLSITLLTGEFIDIDFKRKTIVDSYGSNRYSIKSGDWWYMRPGANLVKFLASAYDPAASLVFTYRDSFLGM